MGQGIGLLPNYPSETEEKSGKLVRILPKWSWGSDALSLVYPAQKFVSPKLRAFVELAVAECGGNCPSP